MPVLLVRKMEQLLAEPSITCLDNIHDTIHGLSDQACELLDDVQTIARKLFYPSGVVTPRHLSVLQQAGINVHQGLIGGRHQIILVTRKGGLSV